MSLFTAKELQNVRVFETAAVRKDVAQEFDIFLSHSYDDKNHVSQIMQVFENVGYKVYVDWIFDKELDRSKVTAESANLLRKRMEQSKCLIYLHSENSSISRWMPWELGFMDSSKHRVAILPITENSNSSNEYQGLEYLGLYPYIYHETNINDLKVRLKDSNRNITFQEWLKSGDMLAVSISNLLKRLK